MGQIAKKLTDKGYKVDGVSPSPVFAQQARDLLPKESEIFECFYEQLETSKQYDLVLFSESFQYIKPDKAIEKSLTLLKPEGHILICDIFKVDIEEKSPLSGGHNLTSFLETVSGYPISLLNEIDITDKTAPNMDIENQIFQDVIRPVSGLVGELLDNRHPMIYRILKWKYKKKIEKMRLKYFSDQRTAENFKKFKSYRLLLYKRK